jgi:hypothetical protein
MSEYWFARRFPVGNPRNAMAPVHPKGWAVVAVFLVAMLLGGLAFLLMAGAGQFAQGVVALAIAAALGGGWFLVVAHAKGDRTRTVADYRQRQVKA